MLLSASFPTRKVFGITTLDNLRLEQFLSCHLQTVTAADLLGDVFTIGGHSGETIVPVLHSWTHNLTEDEYKALVHRVQFGGDEVVKAKNGKGSATLSMATAAYRFVSNLLTAIVDGVVVDEVSFVNLYTLNGVDKLPSFITSEVDYFSLPLKLSKDGIDSVSFPHDINQLEFSMIDVALKKLKGDIAKGVNLVSGPKL
ncbi:unnamed protein product [Ambrosiozyma monospora]|uniref:malate dehydrogenase n=1 Tax=Ambrosiozyma monospora TaxID=43982 RepID=A0A9W6Z240_AMBMO|nr:unnamed protein product [Ambrosiozyma monospora]